MRVQFSHCPPVNDAQKIKISQSLKGRGSFVSTEKRIEIQIKRTAKFLKELPNMDFNSLSYEAKRIKILLEQNFKCLFCGLDEWMGNPLMLELDHEDGNTAHNERSNLRMLCPNCHASTPTWRGRKKALTSNRLRVLTRKKNILKSLSESSND